MPSQQLGHSGAVGAVKLPPTEGGDGGVSPASQVVHEPDPPGQPGRKGGDVGCRPFQSGKGGVPFAADQEGFAFHLIDCGIADL